MSPMDPETGRQDQSPDLPGSWFQRHPMLTGGVLLLLLFAALTWATENILAALNANQPGLKRSIRLREHEPQLRQTWTITKNSSYQQDSLEEKEFVLQMDKDGFIMPSQVHDRPEVTLAFLGGSTTQCFLVEEDQRFPHLTGRQLEQATGRRVNSLNSGVSGNNSLHSLNILVNKIIPFRPDVVILMHNINDLSILLHEGGYWNTNPTRSPVVDITPAVGRNLAALPELLLPQVWGRVQQLTGRLQGFLRGEKPGAAPVDEFQHARGRTKHVDADFLVAEFSLNLQTFVAICRARGILPVLMTQESRLKPEPDPIFQAEFNNLETTLGMSYSAYRDLFQRFNQAIRDVGARQEVLVIDLARHIPQTREFMYDLVHFNTRGSQLAAEIISQELLPIIVSRREALKKEGKSPVREF